MHLQALIKNVADEAINLWIIWVIYFIIKRSFDNTQALIQLIYFFFFLVATNQVSALHYWPFNRSNPV